MLLIWSPLASAANIKSVDWLVESIAPPVKISSNIAWAHLSPKSSGILNVGPNMKSLT